MAIAILAAILISAALLPLLPTDRWWIRILDFPQAQIAALLLLLTLAVPLIVSLRRPFGLVLLAALGATLAYQLQYLLRYTPLWPTEVPDAAKCSPENQVRVLVLNVKEHDPANPEALELVRRLQPDLFLAVETEPEWLRRMAPLRRHFRHVVAATRPDEWGMTLFSRLPLIGPEVRYLVANYVPSLKTGVRLRSGAEIDLYALHPKPPLMHGTQRRNAELLRAGREIAQKEKPALLAGDLNDVPWSYTINRFSDMTGMGDPRVGRAFDATFWLAPLVGWPIDHVYATRDFKLTFFDPLQDVGSDHLPLLAGFCLSRA
ncbi:MAG TPA: endonuclease/exonuclease/phosphatase family protein [Sphingomicrobium sp.]|nr:endonuclease/exonuclease/phosphatase family protein [Sphingomicrobium sp.]